MEQHLTHHPCIQFRGEFVAAQHQKCCTRSNPGFFLDRLLLDDAAHVAFRQKLIHLHIESTHTDSCIEDNLCLLRELLVFFGKHDCGIDRRFAILVSQQELILLHSSKLCFQGTRTIRAMPFTR